MSRCVFVCLMVVAVMCAEASQFIQPPMAKPIPLRNQKGCYSSITSSVIPFDTPSQIPNECAVQTCHQDGYIIGVSCGVISTEDADCTVTEVELSLPHPDCCPKIICNSI